MVSGTSWARLVEGIVLDANDREPIIGASVLAKGTKLGTATDIDGKFQIDVPATCKTLIISYVGMVTVEAPITSNMEVLMKTQDTSLEDVVVVAYGTQKKSSITGAISQVNSKEIEQRPVSSVTSALEGASSGISVMGSYGQPGMEPTISIRGVGTVNGSNAPLYVVDGVPFGGDITDLSPDDIESMSVLKDAASCALYGNRASNGVILITTKKSKEKRPTFTLKVNQGWYKRGIPEYDRVSVPEFMQIEYANMLNGYIGNQGLDRNNPSDMAAAAQYVKDNIVTDRLRLNPFNAADNALFGNDGRLASGVALLPGYAEDLDWFGQGIHTGYRQEYIFNGAGGNDKTDYYFSISYLNEDGYMKNSGFDRLNGRAVVNLQPRKWIKAGLSVNASHQKTNWSAGDTDGGDSSSTTNPFYFSRYIAPIYPVHLHDPKTGDYMLDANGNRQYDPGFYTVESPDGTVSEVATRDQLSNNHAIWESEVNSDRTRRNTLNAIAYVDLYLPYGFTATLKGNLNTANTEKSKYGSALIGGAAKGGEESGSLSKTIYNRKHWTFQQQLNWQMTFNDVHYFNVLLGHENYSYNRDYTYGSKKAVNIEGLEAFTNFNTISSLNGYRDSYRTESYLGRVQYSFDDRYNVEASFRRDGSSRFARDVRWGNFGSVGANWMFSHESFMKDQTWLNFGKLRANWGQVGNDAGSDYYAYYGLYDTDTKGGYAAYVLSQLAANDLKWETGESWGIGLELNMFNRWNLSVEYYDKRNKDLIFDVYNPISAGGTSTDSAVSTITRNLGTISNTGWEINTDVDIFANKDWTINLGANLTTLTNKVKKLPEQNKDGIVSGSYKIVEGKSRYEYFTYHWAGTDMMDGQSLYDANLDDYHITAADGSVIGGTYENGELVSTELAPEDYKLINGQYYVNTTTYAKRDFRGSSLPKVYGSFTPSFRFRDFNLSALFTYSLGGKVMDYGYSSLMDPDTKNPRNYHVDLLNSWAGTPTSMTEGSADRINAGINPIIDANENYNNATSDRWLVSRNYLCLKNINFSYRLPKSIVRKLDLSNVLLSFSAENVFTCTKRKGLQAQQSLSGGVYNSIAPARVFTFGLTVNL